MAVAHDDDENDNGPGQGHGHGRDDIEHQAVAFGVVDSLPDGSGRRCVANRRHYLYRDDFHRVGGAARRYSSE